MVSLHCVIFMLDLLMSYKAVFGIIFGAEAGAVTTAYVAVPHISSQKHETGNNCSCNVLIGSGFT